LEVRRHTGKAVNEFEDAEEGGKEEDKTEKKGKKSEDIPDDDEGVD
jgi:hypothetical protein